MWWEVQRKYGHMTLLLLAIIMIVTATVQWLNEEEPEAITTPDEWRRLFENRE